MVRRELILKSIVTIAVAVVMLSAAPVKADLTNSSLPEGIGYYQQGGILSNAPDYEWWYGCSPTSAGMMMGYYDLNGYGGLYYDNLVPGGTAELSTFPAGTYIANDTIASSGHIADFYVGAFGVSGDDAAGPYHNFNSLADFMGTSQDSTNNSNGSTGFYFYQSGNPLHDYNLGALSDFDGMYGIGEYISYAGYGTTTEGLYTQLTDNNGFGYHPPGGFSGFTFADYQNEIDSGRVVMLHVEGHSMFGYGYEESGDLKTVYLHDTWTLGQKTMTWGGSYSGMDMWGVTVIELTGGAVVPVPAAVLLGILGLGVVGIKLRRYA